MQYDELGMAMGSGDTGSMDDGIDLEQHITGQSSAARKQGGATSMHTWLIVVGALALLWLLSGGFKKVRV